MAYNVAANIKNCTQAQVVARIEEALECVRKYGGIPGHKTWVIDQVVRSLLGDGYDPFVIEACRGEGGDPGAYAWETGTAP